MKAKFLIVYLAYYIILLYAETALLFVTCLCARIACHQGKEALFVSQYHFLNLEDSFV